MDFGIVGTMDRSLHRSRDDLLLAMNLRRVFDDPVAEQGPILHQTKHSDVPPNGRWTYYRSQRRAKDL
jgi:hypothetical protein